MPDRQPLSRILIALGEDFVDRSVLESQFPELAFDFASGDEVSDRIGDVDAALLGFVKPGGTLDRATRLKWIQTVGAGVEHMVGDGFADRGILLTNGSGVMAPNMAEHVVGLMLAFARNLPTLIDGQHRHAWKNGVGVDSVFELGGQTVVLVGLGDIALETAKRLAPFGTTLIGVKRSVTGADLPPYLTRVVSTADLDSVLGEAHHVISSVPHTAETVGLFDAERFGTFRDGAYFYNVGRGTSVVQPDLVAALRTGKLAGAGLDVTTPEPLPADDPLWDFPNVIITGHTAGASPMFRTRLVQLFAENIRRYQAGEPLINVVDVQRGY